jgi:hypothetical protein
MTWEEETLVGKLQSLFRSRDDQNEQRRKRSKRMRYFLTVWGAIHWAERVERRRAALARRGHISL